MVARFAVTFAGTLPLCSATYPTADGWIPARWWALFSDEADAVESARQFRAANASAHGRMLVEAGNKPDTLRATRRLLRRAFPRLHRRRVRRHEEG